MKISFEDYNIPDVFKFIRESANITQLELAKKMHKSVQWVKAVERGTINIKLKTYLEFCRICGIKVLNVKKFTMLFKIILPAALPEIFLGCNQGLGVSFILLTSAEMIGASRGIGFYVKQYSDFGDYTRTIVGLIVIGIVVVVITMKISKRQML